MARLIPPIISPNIKSMAEKRIFEWLRDDSRTANWIVLHSLGISSHNKLMYGEIDFLVLVPNKGIFALEVKGGRVRRENGIWFFTDKYGNVTSKDRGPFEQAMEGIYSVINNIKTKLDDEHRNIAYALFGIGVMFPDIEYNAIGCDEEQWQVFDKNDGTNVYDFIERLYKNTRGVWEKKNGFFSDNKLPTEEDIQYIASMLRGDFDYVISKNVQIKYSEGELLHLTQEQYRVIDQLEDNKRCLVEGGAGTGKTLFAIEEAKKSVARGLRTALLCYNRNLAMWLKKYFESNPQSLAPSYIGTLHSFMTERAKQIKYKNFDNTELFYEETLPQIAISAIEQTGFEKFDKIIIDEAQDIITQNYLNVLDKCLVNGIKNGQWICFGDFSYQAIYAKKLNGEDKKELIERITSFARCKLKINCRNTKSICQEMMLISGYSAYCDVLSKIQGIPVQYMVCDSTEDSCKKAETIIKDLIQNSVSRGKITILSPFRRENSIVSKFENIKICDYSTDIVNEITFSTIQSFKGLENSIIILTDVNSILDRQLMYVAFSRARSALYVIETSKARNEYLEILRGKIQDG